MKICSGKDVLHYLLLLIKNLVQLKCFAWLYNKQHYKYSKVYIKLAAKHLDTSTYLFE